jgi:hypothetical protein
MTGPDSSHERMQRGRAWLGGCAEGGERLARLFQIGTAERAVELERELAELVARARALAMELRALRQLDQPEGFQAEVPKTPTVELRRPPQPGERDYELHRCQGFEVYAGPELLGVVEGVIYESRSDRPDVLEVRSKRFGRRRPLLVPVEDVEAIEPDEAAVIVSEAARSSATRRRLAAAVARLRSSVADG